MAGLLDQAARRINQVGVQSTLEANRRAMKEEEFARAFAELDAAEAMVGSPVAPMDQMTITRLRAELQEMYAEALPRVQEHDGGPDTIIFNKSN